MRYSFEHKARMREKIVKASRSCFQERGVHGVSIADLMEAVGLTHGGFYGHFASKDALISEAMTHGLEESRKLLVKLGGRASAGAPPLEVIIDTYLSIPHRNNVATGCPLPTLGADIARGKRAAKAALTAKAKEIVAVLEAFAAAGGSDDREAVAIGVLSGMIGGMVLARATDDEQCSDKILRSCREFLKRAVAKSGGGSDGRQGDYPRLMRRAPRAVLRRVRKEQRTQSAPGL